MDRISVEARFSVLSRPSLGPNQPPIQCVPGLSRGVKRPGRGVDHPPASSAEVKERVELYLYSPSGFRGLFWSELIKLNSVVLVRERTIPTEGPSPVGEVSANFLRIEGCHVVSATDPHGR